MPPKPPALPLEAPTSPRRSAASALLCVSIATAWLAGCRPEPAGEPERIEPVEITAGPTAAMNAEDDAVAASSGEEALIGVLPGGLPEGLPLPTPASVSDFGTDSDRFVVLRTSLPREQAQSQLAAKLDAAGWASSGDRWTRTRGGDRVVYRFETAAGGQTMVRIEY